MNPKLSVKLGGIALLLGAALSSAACSDGDSEGEPDGGGGAGGEAAGSNSESEIGSDGGSVKAGAAEVEIPEGALEEDVEIGIASVSVDDAEAPDGFEIVGKLYAFTPHGTEFSEPVTISFDYEGASDDLVIVKLDDEEDTTWEVVEGGTFKNGVASIEVDSFSIYGAAIALGGNTDEAVDLEAACAEVCTVQTALNCPNDPDQAGCEEKCTSGTVVQPGEPCFTEYTAFGNCVGAQLESAYECDEEGEANLAAGICEDELVEYAGCAYPQP